MQVLALEVGAAWVKAAVLDVAKGAPVTAIARVDYAVDEPSADAAEVPAERLWSALTAASRKAARSSHDIHGIGLACFTPALVLLDQAEQPLTPIWTPLDRRSRPSARQVWATVGEEFLDTVGSRPLPGSISAISWRQLLHEDPYLRDRVRRYLHVNGWLGLCLTGECAFDPENASCTGLFGTLTDQRWSPHWCEYFLVEPEWLPNVVCGSTTLGTLRAKAAAELGVTAGIPVKLGTGEISSASLAADMSSGDLLHIADTTQTLATMVGTLRVPSDGTRSVPTTARRLTRRLGVGAGALHITQNPVGSAALAWVHQLCFHEQSRQEFDEQSIPAALKRETRVTLDPPFLGGDRLEIDAHRAAFRHLTLASDRLDLLAALLESMRRRQREALVDLGLGEKSQRIFLTGDGAEVVRRLLPEYASATVQLVEGPLRGVARLF